jgi:hypothetical protein
MSTALWALLRPIPVLVLAYLAAGCGWSAAAPPDPFAEGGEGSPATFVLRIDNAHPLEARVEIVWGASTRSLGRIQPGEGESFRLPVEARSFRLAVHFVDGGGYESPPISPRPGQFLRYRIPGR